jgi:exo-1,4-beta-D-glucosaminidase
MHRTYRGGLVLLFICLVFAGCRMNKEEAGLRLELHEGWAIQSSAEVDAGGEALSQPGFATTGWHPATVPTTVVGALVADGTYPNPDFGMNLRQIPGTDYKIATNFSNVEMPEDSPFRVPWWFRTEFTLPDEAAGKTVWLGFGGINYKANVWLNGEKLASDEETAGSWRIHDLDVTGVAKAGATNALAVEVFAPTPGDLALTFVDWNPMPPDKLMGLYRPVTVTTSGPVALRHPQVVTDLDLPSLDRAKLTVKVFARNATDEGVTGTLEGTIGDIRFASEVALDAGEEREVVLTPAGYPQLVVTKPDLWWPRQYGEPNLHDLALEMKIGGAVSDRSTSRFGIREFTASIDDNGHLLYRVNGQRILVRGAGWTSEMMLRYSPERFEQELAYVRDLGLNTVRMEGKLEGDDFFDITDREGIMVMPGWCCCHFWERWKEWGEEDLPIAVAQLRSQILRLRGRASVFTWYNGSDNPPPAEVEMAYLSALEELGFPDPVVSSATEKVAEFSGPSGVKMRGPYEWVPPIYWYTDTKLGGPHGFATEIGPGPAPPPVESLKRFLPEDKLWPINEVWSYHAGGGPFRSLDVFNAAMDARYGTPENLDEYALEAQVAAYESHRAMFEAFRARKYTATGVIQWMLNNAWPGLIWHLYDYYLRPGGSYFGAKKANEPLHVLYDYGDRAIVVVNATLDDFRGLGVTARVLDLDGTERLTRTETADVGPDGTVEVLRLPEPSGVTSTYFVVLTLDDATGGTVSRNVYWLSTKPDTLAWDNSVWYYTPVESYADMTALDDLPPAGVKASARFTLSGDEGRAHVRLENTSDAMAFFVHSSVRQGEEGEEVLPVLWSDNDVTLAPGETLELTATYAAGDLGAAQPAVRVEGWNVERKVAGPPEP